MQTKNQDYLVLDGAKLYYEEAGQGSALVLVHAGIVDSRMWDAQFAFFARHYRTIRFDLRGFGKSDPLAGPIDHRQDLLRLLQHLGIRQAALAGCSLGGEIVLDFALEHPEMTTALVLVSAVPGGFEMQGEPPAALLEMFAALQQNDLDRAVEMQMRMSVDGPFRSPAEVDAAVRQRAAEMNRIAVENGTLLNGGLQPANPLEPPAAARLGAVQAPALVIAGALDHPEILRAADVLHQELPAAQKQILPGSAHLPNMEQPQAFNQALLAFLQPE